MRPFTPLRLAALALSLLTLLSAPEDARANGRFPKAQAIVMPRDSNNASAIYLRATFGILVSRDGGKSWRWICEQALGFSTTWDPPIAATRDCLWVGLTDGARATPDGCTILDVPDLKGELVADLAVDGTGDRVFAVTSSRGKAAFVWRGQAGSQSFTRLGKGITGFQFDTIDVAPSKPSRLYLTATLEGKGTYAHLFRSDDGGATIVEMSPVLAKDARLFVAAVDPHDPNRIYVRALAATGSDVLLSTDGGKTLTSVLHMKGAMFGFAQTRDGSVLYAGSGDPAEGIRRSTDRGVTWQEEAKVSVFCLNAEGPRLLVCSNPYVPGGFAVAESSDQGATVKPLATFDDVLGPMDCDAGAAGGASPCVSAWPATHAAIATSAQVRPAKSTEAPPALRDGGAAVDAGAATESPHASACGCRAAGASSPATRWPLLAVAIALALLTRRRRASGPPFPGGDDTAIRRAAYWSRARAIAVAFSRDLLPRDHR